MKKKYILLVTAIVFLACSEDTTNNTSSESTDGTGGSLATFILKEDYLYTVDSFKLSVFNISDSANPIKVNSVEVGFDIETLFSFKDYLFIGARSAMFIYDISNREFPELLSESFHFTSCDPVVANDTHAYVTLHSNTNCQGTLNELRTFDIEDLTNPILLNVRSLTEPKGLALYGTNYLLVCDDTVKIFDVSNPENSVFVSEIPTKGSIDIIIRDDNAFIISESAIDQYQLNLNDINNFVEISRFFF